MLFLWICPRTMLGDYLLAKNSSRRLKEEEVLVSRRQGVVYVQWCVRVGVREKEGEGEKREVVEKVRFASGAAAQQASTFRSGWLVGKGCDRVRHPSLSTFGRASSCAVSLCVMPCWRGTRTRLGPDVQDLI